jgi:hypothetical protein
MTANTEKMQKVQERLGEVLSRSAMDMEFRKQLVADPRAALSAHFGKEIPETVNIRFLDAQGTPTVVLPEPGTAELSDAELEGVAGGIAFLPALGYVLLGAGIAALGDAIF